MPNDETSNEDKIKKAETELRQFEIQEAAADNPVQRKYLRDAIRAKQNEIAMLKAQRFD